MSSTKRIRRILGTAALVLLLTSPVGYAQESNAELLATLKAMQEQINALNQQVIDLKRQVDTTQNQSAETDAKVEAVAEVVESGVLPQAQEKRTTIAGYGELHYNNLSAEDSSRDVEEIDFHRFVLFFGHEFNDKTRFYSEFELEHSLAGDGKPGEVELEQAFIEFELKQNLYAKAGLFLIPIGILNETHEPNTFYGVERNNVESIIIPSTWWEAGAALNGRWGSDWGWDLALTSGLEMPTTGSSAFRVRSGRQKVAKAVASDGAVTGRLRYLGIPGLQAAVTLHHQFDASQESNDGLDSGTLIEAHVDYKRGPVGLRALYARWDFSGYAVEAAGADTQTGWYIEPSYRLNENFGFYTRYEDIEAARIQDKFNQWELGMNYWPVENVVIKFDYRDRSHNLESAHGRNFKGIDIGVGYSF
jgi:hypothetical protein